jgi:hypothetical protein
VVNLKLLNLNTNILLNTRAFRFNMEVKLRASVNYFEERRLKPYITKNFKLALVLTIVSLVRLTDAMATSTILSTAKNKGLNVTNCSSCHTSSFGSSSNLKAVPGSLPKKTYRDAYLADRTGYTRLKNVINGKCPSGKTVNATTFNCQVQAATMGSLGSKLTGAAATDVYTVTCGAGTTNLYARVRDLAPVLAPSVSIQARKSAKSSILSRDLVDGNVLYSPAVSVAGVAGIFAVNVNKSASSVKGVETYAADIYCRNATGAKTRTGKVLSQNH